ncbi:MAG: metallo-beta-lactamase superfamily protein [Pseudobdellovibrio sp.]|nr:metallo-beta-lactamase superfamily protein [Pseudobdellovibrio sp.]
MQIKFWGVRGSIPHSMDTSGWISHFEKLMQTFFNDGHKSASDIQNFIKSKPAVEIGGFGVSTTCVEVSEGSQSIIIDGGSGIKSVTDIRDEYHILISHFHLDHILGLPFFLPHYKAGCKINYYSAHPETEAIIKSLFQKPMFPVSFGNLQADVKFHSLKVYERNVVNGFTVTPYQTDHPDLCFGFRIEKGGKVYAHAVDNEAVRITKAELGRDAGLYANADLVYFDSQYDDDSIESKKGWGHGTSHRGFEVCSEFAVKQILFAHHDPSFSIEDSLRQQKKTEELFKKKYSHLNCKWLYAYDGLVLKI